jgi:hypothetical protein
MLVTRGQLLRDAARRQRRLAAECIGTAEMFERLAEQSDKAEERRMQDKDLPESKNVVDRRGKKEPQTLQEHIDANQQEPQPERGAPYADSDMAKDLGINDIPGSEKNDKA